MNDQTREGRAPDPSKEAARGGTFRLLFVCTGNTCRSPMAEAIARAKAEELGWEGFEVRSAGAGAFPGAPPSGGAVRTTRAHGLDLSDHRATLLTRREVEWADLILTMSPGHLARVSELGGGDRAALLTTYDERVDRTSEGASIPDPIGGSDEEYARTFRRLEDLIEKLIERLGPGVPR